MSNISEKRFMEIIQLLGGAEHANSHCVHNTNGLNAFRQGLQAALDILNAEDDDAAAKVAANIREKWASRTSTSKIHWSVGNLHIADDWSICDSTECKKQKEVTVKYYCPLDVNGSDTLHCESFYKDDVQRAIDKYDDGDMAEYYHGMQSVAGKLVSVYWGVEAIGYELYGCMTATFKSPLTDEEEVDFKDWLCGQNSDGFGEGFEQQEIKVDDGYLTISFWTPSEAYFIDNDYEFHERLKGRRE